MPVTRQKVTATQMARAAPIRLSSIRADGGMCARDSNEPANHDSSSTSEAAPHGIALNAHQARDSLPTDLSAKTRGMPRQNVAI